MKPRTSLYISIYMYMITVILKPPCWRYGGGSYTKKIENLKIGYTWFLFYQILSHSVLMQLQTSLHVRYIYIITVLLWPLSARFLLYTPTNPGSLGGQPGSYCIPQLTLVLWVVSQVPIVYPNRLWFVEWSARLLFYTPTDSGSLGGQPGSYYIPQPTLVRWVVSQVPIVYPNRLWFAGWSARLLLYTRPTLVRWVVSQVPIV